ncbi:MAG: hypothetical protein RI907_202 [Pseudomonadota bacterium]|jgi:hypothetical protein
MNDRLSGRRCGLLLSLCLPLWLTACGGGGGPSASVSGSEDPNPVRQGASRYQAAEVTRRVTTSDGSGNSLDQALAIVDLETGTEVRRIALDADVSGSAWQAVGRYDAPSATQGRRLGASMVLYVAQGQLMQLALDHTSLGAPSAVSGPQQVCGIDQLHPLNLAGSQAWLLVQTPGPDGLCREQRDNTRLWVATGVPGAAQGLQAEGPGAKTLVGPLASAWGATAAGVLAIDRQEGSLGVYSLDLQRRLSTVALGRPVGPDEDVETYPWMPGNPARLLLRVGDTLSLAEVTEGQLRVLKTLRTLRPGSFIKLAQSDTERFLVDGMSIIAINAQGDVRNVGQVTAGAESVEGLAYAAGRVIVTLRQRSAPGKATVLSLRATDSAPALLMGDGDQSYIALLAVTEDQVWFSRTQSATGLQEIVRMAPDGQGYTTIATNVNGADVLPASQFTLPHLNTPAALVWCLPQAAARTCTGATLQRHLLPNGPTVTLGNPVPDERWTWGLLSYDPLQPGGLPSVVTAMLYLSDTLPSGASRQTDQAVLLWMDPNSAASLRPVARLQP